jgi:predicted membrane chloride channel (bestrophin family)
MSLFVHKKKGKGSYTVHYDSTDSIAVLCQMWGSVWPRVLPYCLWNSALDICLQLLKDFRVCDLGISDKGHTFINLIMAFLMVSRVSLALERYKVARKDLGVMYTETKELVQQACLYTNDKNKDNSAKEWRNNVAYHALTLLRVVQAVLDYPSKKIPAWNVLGHDLKREIKEKLFVLSPRWKHDVVRGDYQENLRVPHMLVNKVRQSIQRQRQMLQTPLEPLQERALHTAMDRFVHAWTGTRYMMTTPHPFPLVQMTRTFLYCYVFTLPFALLSDVTSPLAHVGVIFLITYGYLGLETVAMELDDPFGDSEK